MICFGVRTYVFYFQESRNCNLVHMARRRDVCALIEQSFLRLRIAFRRLSQDLLLIRLFNMITRGAWSSKFHALCGEATVEAIPA